MKVHEAVEQYLSSLRLRGLEPSSVRTVGHAVRTVLEPVFAGDIQALAAEGMGEKQREALSRRISKNTRRPFTPTTVELYINAAKAFLSWAVSKGWIRTNPLERPSLGTLIRELREAARLTRSELEQQTSVSVTSLRALEYDRHRVSRAIYDRLMRSPALARLPAMASQGSGDSTADGRGGSGKPRKRWIRSGLGSLMKRPTRCDIHSCGPRSTESVPVYPRRGHRR